MGARPSRRRQPADPPIALDALPPELLVLVLSHVPPRALVTRCRPVCRAWRDVVDGPSVWLLQLARDRSAEGRALYAVAQRCPPNSEDEEEFPLCALARYCLRSPLGRNLIFNSCGERGCRGRGRTLGAGPGMCGFAGPGVAEGVGVTKTKETGGAGARSQGSGREQDFWETGWVRPGRAWGRDGTGWEEPGAVSSRGRRNGWARQSGRNRKAGPWQKRRSAGIVDLVVVAKEGGARRGWGEADWMLVGAELT